MTNDAPILLVMRLADMVRVHPKQITALCARCGNAVGIFPSGQQVLRECSNVEIVCQVCHPLEAGGVLAPGAEFEPFQSRKKR